MAFEEQVLTGDVGFCEGFDMVRALVLWLFVYAVVAALILGYRHIHGKDIKVAAKMGFAAFVTAVIVAVIFVLEVSH
ncbi:hypothetical protein [Ectothiorhodospira shaposhnikovii]|uniref:hypothetical protein n=1 Tax=Ectothiorhodospira shaposhnikovii TaxID=1054 RepID=UPI001EE991FF|nr:hypothetical protein [Ectothiorhodospira shaposhnikovii]MCG5512792.1 hypothetical protein [Ectothiorhodospira shaposhnikovii]